MAWSIVPIQVNCRHHTITNCNTAWYLWCFLNFLVSSLKEKRQRFCYQGNSKPRGMPLIQYPAQNHLLKLSFMSCLLVIAYRFFFLIILLKVFPYYVPLVYFKILVFLLWSIIIGYIIKEVVIRVGVAVVLYLHCKLL